MSYLFLQVLIVPGYLFLLNVYLFFHCVEALNLKIIFAFRGYILDLIAEKVLSCLLLDGIGGFRPYFG